MKRWATALGIAVLAAGCHGGGNGGGTCAWMTMRDQSQLDRSVLSVWERAPGDAWFVGGGLGVPGKGALVLHYDGHSFTEIPTGRSESLWWAWGIPSAAGATAPPDLWFTGEQGLALHGDGTTFTVVPTGTTATLFGVWGLTSDDVWLVGGLPGTGVGPDNDVVLHWDGHTITRDTSADRTARGVAFFKVWGATKDDLWVTGETGSLWRRTPAGWTDFASASLSLQSLTTVNGCSATEVYAVGGSSLLTYDGATWHPIPNLVPTSIANGVSCGDQGVLIVGNAGLKIRFDRAAGTWTDDTGLPPADTDFHGAFAAPDGHSWAVGGNFFDTLATTRNGVIAEYACTAP